MLQKDGAEWFVPDSQRFSRGAHQNTTRTRTVIWRGSNAATPVVPERAARSEPWDKSADRIVHTPSGRRNRLRLRFALRASKRAE